MSKKKEIKEEEKLFAKQIANLITHNALSTAEMGFTRDVLTEPEAYKAVGKLADSCTSEVFTYILSSAILAGVVVGAHAARHLCGGHDLPEYFNDDSGEAQLDDLEKATTRILFGAGGEDGDN